MIDIFRYHPDILTHHPNLIAGVIFAREARNGPPSEALISAYRAEQKIVLERITGKPLSEIPSLAAWRKVFRGFGVKPTQYRNAAEALMRRLSKHGDIPSINAMVDCANLISIRYALPVAVFDTRALTLPVTVRYADGDEPFTPLGESEPVYPDPGEVVFTDQSRKVIARRWCWRQSHDSAAGPDTIQAIITVEAHHENAAFDIGAASNDLLMMMGEHIGGSYTSGLLGPNQPNFSV
jgi:DNA/RNA-binding domain of Phe-tRNA-synthetase-like protein